MSTKPQSRRCHAILRHLSLSKKNTSASGGLVTKIGSRGPNDVVVVSALRTAIGKARKGSFRDTTPDVLLSTVLKATVDKTKVPYDIIGDICVGNVQLGGSYAGPGRMAQFVAGFPETVPLSSVNRQCSSGLQACANIGSAIVSGSIDGGIACGVESMSFGGGVAKGTSNSQPPPIDFNAVSCIRDPSRLRYLSDTSMRNAIIYTRLFSCPGHGI